MVKFVTICGGRIKRVKGRFGGDSASKQGERAVGRCRFADMQRCLTAADRRFAATVLGDNDTSDFVFDYDPFARIEPVRPGTALYNHLFDSHVPNGKPASVGARDVPMQEHPRIRTTLHNDRKSRTYRDGMRIYSAHY
jgi:hypothetical protein